MAKKPQMGLAGGAWARTHERVMAEMEKARQERMKSRGYKRQKKGDMKKYLLAAAAVMLMGAGVVSAQTAPEPITTSRLFDFGDFFANVRGGYAINQHQQLSTVFYTPWKVFHTKANLPLASINLGYDGLQKRPLVAIGLRADNLDSLLWNGKWGKEHVTTAKLPSLEFGPFVSFWPVKTDTGYKLDVSYGAALAIGFSIGGR